MGFSRDPSWYRTNSYVEVTGKSSTGKGLICALGESSKEHFKCLSQDSPLWGDVMSTILTNPLQRFQSKEGLHYHFEWCVRNPLECDQAQITLGNRLEAVIGQATSNLIYKFRNHLRIPYRSCTALLGKAYIMQESWAQGFLWVRKVWFAFAQRGFTWRE